ncbi:alpha/beta hydrolase family protein [Aequorivita lipolytica]|uniref:Alpha/beta hydrolase n=1 Tax=Aequorivita lipolytica TaxID=153267 RepID=A0A5C6YLP0_9FLAO|nr:alpha/beta hydrolase [Aequorivita lipolytica]TXD67834.1 alpha/beta hydrolase [Aequorivita lipolytica]SRX53947.1 Esterase EstD [Aequorivita lipolytica]
MKHIFIIFLLFFGIIATAQNKKYNSEDLSITPLIDGTLIVPEVTGKLSLAIIIGGSGPTDRNGNQQMVVNNSLKFLAEGIYEKGIASFRYDKRIVKQMKRGSVNEKNIRFDDFIDDAIAILNYFKKDARFSKIYIIGHSQGSLVGMVAAQQGADGFVSIAGAGQAIDAVIVDQLAQQAPGLADNARSSFDDLRANGVANNYSPGLASIFRKDIQPFIYTWMKYDPKIEISKLTIPVLIINGDKDIQVQVSEAELLKNAKPDAQFEIIPKMNHVLKEIEGNDLENSKSYNIYNLPIVPELITIVSDFMKK